MVRDLESELRIENVNSDRKPQRSDLQLLPPLLADIQCDQRLLDCTSTPTRAIVHAHATGYAHVCMCAYLMNWRILTMMNRKESVGDSPSRVVRSYGGGMRPFTRCQTLSTKSALRPVAKRQAFARRNRGCRCQSTSSSHVGSTITFACTCDLHFQ